MFKEVFQECLSVIAMVFQGGVSGCFLGLNQGCFLCVSGVSQRDCRGVTRVLREGDIKI